MSEPPEHHRTVQTKEGRVRGVRTRALHAIPLHFERLPRYVVLLVAMLGEIMVAPLLVSSWSGMLAARLTIGIVLIAALWAAGLSRTNLICFLATAAALIVAAASHSTMAERADYTLRCLFVAYVAAIILRDVLKREQVTFDTIAGAACVYMLIGLAWTPVYLLIESIHPGSFDIPAGWRIGAHGDISPALLYFSYVTLTTVGFGDIKPTGPIAGGLVVVEAVVGPLYLAITVARLVGLHIASRSDGHD